MGQGAAIGMTRAKLPLGAPQKLLSYFSQSTGWGREAVVQTSAGYRLAAGGSLLSHQGRGIEEVFERREGIERRAPRVFQRSMRFRRIGGRRCQTRSRAFQLAHLILDVLYEAQSDRVHAQEKLYQLVL